MPKEFINPNLHVILIHYPLGLLTLGTLIELFSFFWRRSAFRAAGRWMILLGALSLAPAATSGLYAMADVNGRFKTETDMQASWAQVRAASPIQHHAWEMMQEHGWYNAIGSAVILLLVVSYLAASDVFRRRAYPLYLLLLLGGLSAIVLGAWHGGEMIYRHGVGVEPAHASAGSEEEEKIERRVDYFLPPLQVHVILAGLAVSLGLAAIGLSFRAGSASGGSSVGVDQYGYALNPSLRPPDPRTTAAQLNYPDPAMMPPPVVRQPVARFWVLGALAGILAALAGWWTLATFSDVWNPNELWQMVQQSAESEHYRRLAHVGVGVGLVVLMLLLALVARVAAGRRFVLALFVLVLLAAVGAQVWLGSLLLFDSHEGTVWKFNSGAEESSAPSSTGPTTAPATIPATTPVASNVRSQ